MHYYAGNINIIRIDIIFLEVICIILPMIWKKLKIHLSQDQELLKNIETVQNFITEIQDIAHNDQKYK